MSRELVKVDGSTVRVGDTTTWQGAVATFIASQDVKESSRALYTRTLSQFFKWIESTGRAPRGRALSPDYRLLYRERPKILRVGRGRGAV